MLGTSAATLVATGLIFNVHYVLFGRPFLEGPLTSRPVLTLGNMAFAQIIRAGMAKEGVPLPDRTEPYGRGGRIDVYEPGGAGSAPRPAVL